MYFARRCDFFQHFSLVLYFFLLFIVNSSSSSCFLMSRTYSVCSVPLSGILSFWHSHLTHKLRTSSKAHNARQTAQHASQKKRKDERFEPNLCRTMKSVRANVAANDAFFFLSSMYEYDFYQWRRRTSSELTVSWNAHVVLYIYGIQSVHIRHKGIVTWNSNLIKWWK